MLKISLFVSFFFLEFATSINASETEDSFTFNGFNGVQRLSLNGAAFAESSGVLELTRSYTAHSMGHAFYSTPFTFKSATGKVLSFSTTFVFSISPLIPTLGGQGIAFIISPTVDPYFAAQSQYFGLFNLSTNENSTNHIFAVKLGPIQNPEFNEIDDNHVGIDIDGLISTKSHTAGYYDGSTASFKNLSLFSGQPLQLWIDFNGENMQLDVTLSPMLMPKPKRPLLTSIIDFDSLMLDSMYVGFSSSTAPFYTTSCIHGWSFKMNGMAAALDLSMLPPLTNDKSYSVALKIWLPFALCLFLLLVVVATVTIVRRRKYAELLEDWELDYGPQRFSYRDLFRATKGFKDGELLGTGGFGRVYKGVLPTTNTEVAVKKVSRESRQGMKEFVAEIVTIGQLSHRNLVQLLGYCRRKGELLLIYDFMPNSSLDKFLFDRTKPTLNWDQRFRIIKGVASGLLYLHEDAEHVVIHRDVKASNVLLDTELNGRLGDFGLARLYDHGTDPKTTHVAGTMGYLAPELARTGKATTSTDVYAFGVFLLEVVCGRRPLEQHKQGIEMVLIDWVLASWQNGTVLETRDSRLEEFCANEIELVLKLGLLCSNPVPIFRPTMRQVLQFLKGDATLPEIPPSYQSYNNLSWHNDGFNGHVKLFSSKVSSISGISVGR